MKRWMMLLSVLVLMSLAIPAWAAPSLTMSAQLSNEGRTRQDGWTTLYVNLVNEGGDVSGDLVVTTAAWAGESTPTSVVPVSLPAGGKKRVPIEIYLMNMSPVQVEFMVNGRSIQAQEVNQTMLASDALLIGVLSEDELGIPGLAQIAPGNGTSPTQVTRLDAATFPTRTAMLMDFDMIALSRFDTATLSQEQLQALETWVGKGGTLLLGAGPEWKRTLSPLPPSLLPVEVTGVGQSELTALGALAGRAIEGSAPIAEGRPLRGRVVAGTPDHPLMVVDPVGRGKVIYLAADPTLAPLANWPGQGDLYSQFLKVEHWQGPGGWNSFDNYVSNALQRIPGLGLPSTGVVAAMLAGYLLLLGPVNYLILKRLDRREWAWGTVPVLSLAFVAVVYLVGVGPRAAVVSHLITVTELSPGTDTATLSAYVGVYAPSKTRMEIPVEGTALIRPFYGWYSGREQGFRLVAGEKRTVELLNLNDYSMRGFTTVQDLRVPGSIELIDAKMTEVGTVTGRIINRLDRPLNDVQITVGRDTHVINRLEPGATSDPFEVGLAFLDLPGTVGNRLMYSGVMGMGNVTAVPAMPMMMQKFQSASWSLENSQIVVTAFTDQPLAPVHLPELGRMHEGSNLVFAAFPMPVDLESGDIPPGLVNATLTSGDMWGESPDGFSLHDGTYLFSLFLPPIDRAKIAQFNLHVQRFDGDSFRLHIKNQQTGEWKALPADPVQPLPDWADYVSGGGELQLRIDVTSYLWLQSPTISTKGVGQ